MPARFRAHNTRKKIERKNQARVYDIERKIDERENRQRKAREKEKIRNGIIEKMQELKELWEWNQTALKETQEELAEIIRRKKQLEAMKRTIKTREKEAKRNSLFELVGKIRELEKQEIIAKKRIVMLKEIGDEIAGKKREVHQALRRNCA